VNVLGAAGVDRLVATKRHIGTMSPGRGKGGIGRAQN
jgi:hypothetical protein